MKRWLRYQEHVTGEVNQIFRCISGFAIYGHRTLDAKLSKNITIERMEKKQWTTELSFDKESIYYPVWKRMKGWTSGLTKEVIVGVVAIVGVFGIYLYYGNDGTNGDKNDQTKLDEEEKKEKEKKVKAHSISFAVRHSRDYGNKLMDDIMAIRGFKDAVYEKELKVEDCDEKNEARISLVIRQEANERAKYSPLVQAVNERLEQDEKVNNIKVKDIPYFLN